MKLNKITGSALAVVLLALFGLAGWGHLTGLDPSALDAVRVAAGSLGAIVLAALGALVKRAAE